MPINAKKKKKQFVNATLFITSQVNFSYSRRIC